ncbi:MAG: FtsX-like permease family protein [Pseudomonadota bacterium]
MIRQVLAVTWLNFKSMRGRLASTCVVIAGIGGVVAVLLGLLAMSSGFRATLIETAQPDRALVLRGSSNNEMDGWITPEELARLETYDDFPVVSGELYVTINAVKRSADSAADVVGRGVSSAAFALRPEVKIVAGRQFQPGKQEVIVGAAAASQYAGLSIGDTIATRNAQWLVVGQFAAAGTSVESEIWMDLPMAQAAFQRQYSVARVKLAAPDDHARLALAIQDDPRLDTTLMLETEYYAAQSATRAALIETFAYLIAGIMAVGAISAALNTMYIVVGQRTVEVGTLRALGFNRVSVAVSVLIESLLLALAGSLAAALLVYVLLDGYLAATQNLASGNQLAFAFSVTPDLIRVGIGCALALGLLGGFLPALKAARLPITKALRGG